MKKINYAEVEKVLCVITGICSAGCLGFLSYLIVGCF